MSPAIAIDKLPTNGLPKLSDLSNVKRFTDSVLVYIAPAGRSPLEVLRNYQQDLKSGGFTPLCLSARRTPAASHLP